MFTKFVRTTRSSFSAAGAKLVRRVSGKAAHKTSPATAVYNVSRLSEEIFQREDKFGAHNYHPLPVALCKAQGQPTPRDYSQLTRWFREHRHLKHAFCSFSTSRGILYRTMFVTPKVIATFLSKLKTHHFNIAFYNHIICWLYCLTFIVLFTAPLS